MKTFFEALSATIPASEIASKNGLSYLSAATAMSLAGRPELTFVDFDGKPYLACLNGALVAVDLPVDGSTLQRMYLPVMDRDNRSMALGDVKIDDINSNRQRCLVKAIATVFGAGMSLYLGHSGDGGKAVKMLGIEPTTDLTTVTPIVAKLEEGGEPYIEWTVGVAACRITDPTFHWEVVEFDGKPYREVLGGVQVEVLTVYQGKKLILPLPILDGAFEPIPVNKVTTFDWNKTVMRALTKCIAFNSGYGLSVYAEGPSQGSEGKNGKKGSAKSAAAAAASTKADTAAPATAAAPAPAKSTAAQAEAEKVASTPVEQASAAAPAPAPVVAEPASSASSSSDDAVGRFKGVMQSRKNAAGVPGLLTLFEALKLSTKFADADKPACAAVLVSALAGQAEGQDSVELVNALKTYGSMVHVPADARDLIAARITTNFVAATLNDGDDVLKAAPGVLVSAGVATDFADVMRLAVSGGVPAETLDLLNAMQESTTV